MEKTVYHMNRCCSGLPVHAKGFIRNKYKVIALIIANQATVSSLSGSEEQQTF